jgi:hypothetical protein
MPPPPPVGGGGAHTSFDNDPRFNELMKKCAMVCKGTADQETLYNICVVVFRQQLQARTDGQVNLQDAMIAVMSMVENNVCVCTMCAQCFFFCSKTGVRP